MQSLTGGGRVIVLPPVTFIGPYFSCPSSTKNVRKCVCISPSLPRGSQSLLEGYLSQWKLLFLSQLFSVIVDGQIYLFPRRIQWIQLFSKALVVFYIGKPEKGLSSRDSVVSFPGGASAKESACPCRRYKRRGFGPWVRKILWSRKGQSSPIFLAWKIP